MLKNKNVVLGISGSIAAYKAAELASLLVKANADVRALMTKNAEKFISPITFETLTGHKCISDTFDRNFEFKASHVSIAKRADLFIIAPATANVIAKVANGLADDMLTSTILAATCKKIICPAMNTDMYENPVTQRNIEKCRRYGIKIVEPETGYLACGDTGKGKLASPEFLFQNILFEIQFEKDLAGKKILVTAGPTQEAIDPVRYITNHSSGKMGFAIARNAAARGADVTLVSGPTELAEPPFIKTIHVKTAKEMFEAVRENFEAADIIVKAAAVADFRPKFVSEEKIKKSGNDISIQLERTDDILKWLGERKKKNQFLCGFSMETQNMAENSRAKLEQKNLDMIVANNLKTEGAGFKKDTNVVTIMTREFQKEFPLMTKDEVAFSLLCEIKKMLK